MKAIYPVLCCLVIFCRPAWAGVPVPAWFSLFDGEVTLLADGSRGPFRISDRAIEKDSEQVWANGVLLVRDIDYFVNADRALLTLYRVVPLGTRLVVRFRQAPEVVGPVFRGQVVLDTTAAQGVVYRTGQIRSGAMEGGDDAPKLDIGGSKRIAVTFGSDRSHTVDQTLQVRVSGEVADGVSVLAVLSDRNLPVTESGDTRALRELDRVLFQVQSGGMSAELGDLDAAFNRTTFGRYRRQLQGGQVSVAKAGVTATVLGAMSRGDWTSQRIAPVEGYQGPYRLPGGSALLGRIVPESERVYLNGRLLRRGDGLDYVVDYEAGTVTFSPELPIEAESRIVVDYQAVADGVRSRLVGIDGQSAFDGNRVTVGTTFIRESDQPVLSDVNVPGAPLSHRQVAVLDAAYAPRDGVHLKGEVAQSDHESGQGRAFRLDGAWTSAQSGVGQVRVSGWLRDVGAGFEGFERLDTGLSEGRWGWQQAPADSADREGELSVYYAPRASWALTGVFGRRRGALSADRRSFQVQAPFGTYDYEHIGPAAGGLTRQHGRVSYDLGPVQPGFEFHLENAWGSGVPGASIFYATGAFPSLPGGVGVRELRWDVAAGQAGVWSWRSALQVRRIRQQAAVWEDSLRAWSQSHQVTVTRWHGWSLSGMYTRSSALMGSHAENRQITHLGRVQVQYARSGLTQQVSYRISTTGVQNRQPVFVEVGRGLGTYVWEDVNGNGVQEPEEFVPDVDGDYNLVYTDSGAFQPARDGALGAHVTVDFDRLTNRSGWWRSVSVDVSLTADRQTSPGAPGAAPWQLLGFAPDSTMLSGQRDLWVRLFLFRYHQRGSLQLSGRWRDHLNRVFYAGGTESEAEGGVRGLLRLSRRLDMDANLNGGTRRRDDPGAFAYAIRSLSGGGRLLWRPVSDWQMQAGVSGGRDRDRVRDLSAVYLSFDPEVIRALPGRGRLQGSLEWTRVSASAPLPLFMGMADGNREGQNWVWRLGVDYRFGRYVTALLSYDGRKRPGEPVIHLGRVEVKAVF